MLKRFKNRKFLLIFLLVFIIPLSFLLVYHLQLGGQQASGWPQLLALVILLPAMFIFFTAPDALAFNIAIVITTLVWWALVSYFVAWLFTKNSEKQI